MTNEKKLLEMLDEAMGIIEQLRRDIELQEKRHELELLQLRAQVRLLELWPVGFTRVTQGHDLSVKQNEAFDKVAADWNRQAEALVDGRDLPTLAERE